MDLDLTQLPDDVEGLRRIVHGLAAEIETDRTKLAEAQSEIDRLRLILKKLQRSQFGRRSERMDGGQLDLGLEDVETDIGRLREELDPSPATTNSSADTKRQRALPPDLPREDVLCDVDYDHCPGCGGALHEIGESVSEMLDWVPAQPRVIRIRRPKYGCRACDTVHQAAAPERPIAKGMATPGLLAQVLVAKYCDHLPLYRQAEIFARHGIEFDRSTLANWVGGATWWLEALHDRLGKEVFAASRLFADDTPLPVLDPGRGRTKTGRFWVYVRDDRCHGGCDPPAALYLYSTDRKAERKRTSMVFRRLC